MNSKLPDKIEQPNNQTKWTYFQTYFFVKIEFSLTEEKTE